MDQAGPSCRVAGDQLGPASTSLATDVYLGRTVLLTGAADTLEEPVAWSPVCLQAPGDLPCRIPQVQVPQRTSGGALEKDRRIAAVLAHQGALPGRRRAPAGDRGPACR